MKVGELLRKALSRKGILQADIARRAPMDPSTLSKILTGETASPYFYSVAKIIKAGELTWGEVFEEPQMRLSDTDATTARAFREVLDRIIENDARQKKISRLRDVSLVRDSARRENYDEVEELESELIPEEYQRVHANRVYRVRTDAMELLEGSLIFARATQDIDSADGQTVVCRLNGKLYLRRLDVRGGRTTLEATNPRYLPIRVDPKKDRFSLIAVIRAIE